MNVPGSTPPASSRPQASAHRPQPSAQHPHKCVGATQDVGAAQHPHRCAHAFKPPPVHRHAIGALLSLAGGTRGTRPCRPRPARCSVPAAPARRRGARGREHVPGGLRRGCRRDEGAAAAGARLAPSCTPTTTRAVIQTKFNQLATSRSREHKAMAPLSARTHGPGSWPQAKESVQGVAPEDYTQVRAAAQSLPLFRCVGVSRSVPPGGWRVLPRRGTAAAA